MNDQRGGRVMQRPATTNGRAGRAQANSDPDWGRQGRAGLTRAAQERKEAENRRANGNAPYRFFLGKGEQAIITVLDVSFDDAWFMYEHTIPGPGQNWKEAVNTGCPREWEECPICQEAMENSKGRFSHSVYTMFLTIIEDRQDNPYEDKNGNMHYFQKRILAMKASQAAEFERILTVAFEQHGTIRGLTMLMARDNGTNSSRVGRPIIMDDGQMYQMYAEADLDEWFGNDAVLGDDGKVVKEENWNITPYDYGKTFPKPTAEGLADMFNLNLPAGSQGDINRSLREGEGDTGGRAARSGARGGGQSAPPASGGRGAPPARGGTREAAGTTGARGRATRVQEEQQDQGDGQDQNDGVPHEETRQETTRRPPPSRGRPAAPAPTQTVDGTSRRVAPRGGEATPPTTRGRPAPQQASTGRTRQGSVPAFESGGMDDDIPF